MAEDFGLETSIHPQPPQMDPDSISADDPEGMARAIQEMLKFQSTLPRYQDDLKDSLGRNFIAANASIDELFVKKLVAETLATQLLFLGQGTNFVLDGTSRKIIVYDQQSPPVKRLEIGLFGGGADAGLKGWDAGGNLIFTLAGGTESIVNEVLKKIDTPSAGVGIENIYAVYSDENLPSALDPSRQSAANAWGFEQPKTLSGGGASLSWHAPANFPSVSGANPYLFRSGRITAGKPAVGDAVADSWSSPAIVGRWGPRGATGQTGPRGEEGQGVEYTYAAYSSDTLPATLRPSDSWGYLVSETIGAVDDTLTLSFRTNAFFQGTSVTIEPPYATRPQITDTAFLHDASDTRYFGALRFYGTNPPNDALSGHLELQFTDEQTKAVDEGDTGQDLSPDFETRGRVTITINDPSEAEADRTLTFLMSAADASEPYIFSPANSEQVIEFADRFKVKGPTSLTSTVTLDILSATDRITWHNSKEGVKLDTTNRYLWQAGRVVLGAPVKGASVADDWSVPVLTGVYGTDGKDGKDGVFSPDDIEDGAIITRMLRDATIEGSKIARSAVSARNIADLAITAAKLAKEPLITTQAQLSAEVVNTKAIAAGAVVASHITSGGIRAQDIVADGTLTATQMAAKAVEAGYLAAGAINAGNLIVDGIIDANHLKANAVTADKIRGDVRNVDVLWPAASTSGKSVVYRSSGNWVSFSLSQDIDDYYQIQGVARVTNRNPNLFAPWAILTSAIGTTRGNSAVVFGIVGGAHSDDTAVLRIAKSSSGRTVYMESTEDDENCIIYDIVGIKNPGTTISPGAPGTPDTGDDDDDETPGGTNTPRGASKTLFSGTSAVITPFSSGGTERITSARSLVSGWIEISLNESGEYDRYLIEAERPNGVSLGRYTGTPPNMEFVTKTLFYVNGGAVPITKNFTIAVRKSGSAMRFRGWIYASNRYDGGTLSYPYTVNGVEGVRIVKITGVND